MYLSMYPYTLSAIYTCFCLGPYSSTMAFKLSSVSKRQYDYFLFFYSFLLVQSISFPSHKTSVLFFFDSCAILQNDFPTDTASLTRIHVFQFPLSFLLLLTLLPPFFSYHFAFFFIWSQIMSAFLYNYSNLFFRTHFFPFTCSLLHPSLVQFSLFKSHKFSPFISLYLFFTFFDSIPRGRLFLILHLLYSSLFTNFRLHLFLFSILKILSFLISFDFFLFYFIIFLLSIFFRVFPPPTYLFRFSLFKSLYHSLFHSSSNFLSNFSFLFSYLFSQLDILGNMQIYMKAT